MFELYVTIALMNLMVIACLVGMMKGLQRIENKVDNLNNDN